jgi:hypothetical protein
MGLTGTRYKQGEEWLPYFEIQGACKKGEQCGTALFETSEVRIAPTKAERAAGIEKALAYQATLTKMGKPRAVRG